MHNLAMEKTDLAFCTSPKDGTSANKGQHQAYKTYLSWKKLILLILLGASYTVIDTVAEPMRVGLYL